MGRLTSSHSTLALGITAMLIITAAFLSGAGTDEADAASPVYLRTDGSDALCDGTADAPAASTPNCAKATLAAAVAVVDPDSTIIAGDGTFVDPAQVVFDKNVTLTGQGPGETIFVPGFNTLNSADLRGWWLVNDDVTAHISGLTMNGEGWIVWQAIRHRGEGTITNAEFANIAAQSTADYSGAPYAGTAVTALNGGPVDVSNSTFTRIGRIGVHYFGSGVNGSIYSGNTYTGKGDGDWLDYAVEVTVSANVTIQNSTVSGNLGIATSSDGSVSAGYFAHTAFGAGTDVLIQNNLITGNADGIFFGFGASDSSTGDVIGNCIANNATGIRMTGDQSSVTANGNDIAGNTSFGVRNTGAAGHDVTDNFWGASDGPSGDGPGSGDAVSTTGGALTFAPFATTPQTDLIPCARFGTIVIEKVTEPAGGSGFDFTSTIPGGAAFSLDGGGSQTFTLLEPGAYSVTEASPLPGHVLTGLTCTDGGAGTPSTGNTATGVATINLDPGETVTCTYTNTASADVTLAKGTSAASVEVNAPFSYTLTAGNGGPTQAENVTVVDTLPAGATWVSDTCGAGPPDAGNVLTWDVGTLGTGASVSCTINVTAPAAPATLTNTAVASSTTPDPDPTNNEASAVTAVQIAALAVDKDGPAAVPPGALFAYTITLTNGGSLDAAAVSLTDTLPSGLTLLSVEFTGTPGTCNSIASANATGILTCAWPSLPAGATVVVTLGVQAPNTGGSLLVNTVEVSTSSPEDSIADNTDSVTTSIGTGAVAPIAPPPAEPTAVEPTVVEPEPTAEATPEPTGEPTAPAPEPTDEPADDPTAVLPTVVEPEPTATMAAPMPPATGTGSGGDGSSAALLTLLGAICIALGGAAFVTRWRRNTAR